jgi:hypothetical protein
VERVGVSKAGGGGSVFMDHEKMKMKILIIISYHIIFDFA